MFLEDYVREEGEDFDKLYLCKLHNILSIISLDTLELDLVLGILQPEPRSSRVVVVKTSSKPWHYGYLGWSCYAANLK